MNRRRLIALAAVAAASLSGCATFTDNDVAARVDDSELGEAQFAQLLDEALEAVDPTSEAARISSTNATGVLNNFVLYELLVRELAEAGVDVEPLAADMTLEDLSSATNTVIASWQEAPPIRPTDLEIENWYDASPLESNIVCSAHILLDNEADAEAALDRLTDGETFGDVAADVSTDTVSATNDGIIPCIDTQAFASEYIPEFVEAALGAEIGVPVGPVESQFGYHVIRLRPLDELATDELDQILAQPSVRFGFVTRGTEVYINPRYGTFDPLSGVIPLG